MAKTALDKMKNRAKNWNIYMIIETTDATGCYIKAVLVDILNKDENKKPWLFELTEVPSTNCNGKPRYSKINRFWKCDMFRNLVKNSNSMCDVPLSM